MSLHPSLKVDSAGAQQRSVLTRIERIKDLMKKGTWIDGQAIRSLPKTKIVRVKAQKKTKEEKDETAEGEAAAEGTAEAGTSTGAEADAKPAK